MAYRSKALIPEQPLLVLPSLAKAIGLNEAIILQQLHYWLQASTHLMDGQRWTYNTYVDWQKQFPFWSVDTIKRTFYNLEQKGFVISGNFNKFPLDRTKWYSVNYEKIPIIEETQYLSHQPDCAKTHDDDGKMPRPSVQNATILSVQNAPTITRDYTETTNRDNTAGCPAAEIEPISAPISQNPLNNKISSEEPAKTENPSEIESSPSEKEKPAETGSSYSEKDNPRAADKSQDDSPDLSTTRKCLDYVSRAKNKPAALYACLVRTFPEGNFPPPGEKRECPLIGRVGLMAKKYSWARVLVEMGHARVDLDAGRIVAGDLLGWIEGRLKGGRNVGDGKNRQHPGQDANRRGESGAQSCPYDPSDPNDPWSKFREVTGEGDGSDA